MKRKMTILLFSLLLAVGWTSDAQAQELRGDNPAKVFIDAAVSPKPIMAESVNLMRDHSHSHSVAVPMKHETEKINFKAAKQIRQLTDQVAAKKEVTRPTSRAARANAPLRAGVDYDMKTITKDEADAITYMWDNGDGTGPRPSKATDVAKDPYQMYELLREVYTNPDFPGPYYSAFTQNDVRERKVYYGAIEGGWNIGGDVLPNNPTSTITVPVETFASKLVANGTNTSPYVPIWGYWYDNSQKNQMIYTSSTLGLERGTVLTSITFYSAVKNWSGGTVTLSLGETTNTYFTSNALLNNVSLTQVATAVTPPSTTGAIEWTINFTQPYTYNGGNLLVQVESTAGTYGGGSANTQTFYGVSNNSNTGYYSCNSRGNQTPTRRQFLPKATFGYKVTGEREVTYDLTYQIGDINIKASSYEAWFYSIKLYDENDNIITSWDPSFPYSSDADVPLEFYQLPFGWSSNGNYFYRYYMQTQGGSTFYYGFLSSGNQPGTLTIPRIYTAGHTSVRLEIVAVDYDGSPTLTVNNRTPVSVYSETLPGATYSWTLNAEHYPYTNYNPDYYLPNDEGYTALIVAVKNDAPGTDGAHYEDAYDNDYHYTKQEIIDYLTANVDSIKLLTDGMRIGAASDYSIGTLFNAEGTYNKFFFLGKGQAKQKPDIITEKEITGQHLLGELVPFRFMYEQFSPTSGAQGSQTADFYSKMMEGNVYPVVHDCRSVIELGHQFSMSGNTGITAYAMTGMNFFIPDYRLKYWENDYYIEYLDGHLEGPYLVDGRITNPYQTVSADGSPIYDPSLTFFDTPSNFSFWYAQYNQDYAPKVGLYKITLDAEATQVAQDYTPDNRNYAVTLHWVSSLDEMTGHEVHQTYTVYYWDPFTGEKKFLVVDGVTTVNGETGETTLTYYVEQFATSYILDYIVEGRPDDADHAQFVAISNVDGVVIPGWEDFVGLVLDHHESDFVVSDMANYYRNFLAVVNEDVYNGLTVADITGYNENNPSSPKTPKNTFNLYRWAVKDGVEQGEQKVAVLTFDRANETMAHYKIFYKDEQHTDLTEQTILNGPTNNPNKYQRNQMGIPDSGYVRIKDNGDIIIWPNGYHVNFKSITVKNNGTVVTSWNAETMNTLPNSWIVSPGSKWEEYITSATSDKVGYMEGGGYIAIPNMLNNYTSLTVEIEAYGDGAAVTKIAVNDDSKLIANSAGTTYTWTVNAPTTGNKAPNRAVVTESVTVHENGTATNEYLPLLGYYYDYRQQWSQMIYTADQLGDLATGDVIKSITFYPTTSTLNLSGGEIHVYMANTTESNFDAAFQPVSVDYNNTLVASFTPGGNINCANGWTITFNTPFTYTGGNIVIDIDTNIGDTYTEDGDGFYGANTSSYMGIFLYYETSGSQTGWTGGRFSFQPKVTFTYETEGGETPPDPSDPTGLDPTDGGLLRLHLLMVDQFKQEIPDDNSHPETYGYVLKYEPVGGDDEQSGKVLVNIEKTDAQVNGFYTQADVASDTDRHLTRDILTADVSMNLPDENPDVLYYQMQGKLGSAPALNQDYLSKLQYMKNISMYEEMLETSPNLGVRYNPDDTYHYFVETEVQGTYGSSFMTYAPSVSTWGIDRRYFENDGYNNTYGAPIWKTGVGKVDLQDGLKVEKQVTSDGGASASVMWTDNDGQSCNLYMLDNVLADAYLPKTVGANGTNVEYVPYMIRVFVESPTGMLRGFLPAANNNGQGMHPENDPNFTNFNGPWCVYEELVDDYTIVNFDDGGHGITWHLTKDVTNWDNNARFGALSSLITGSTGNYTFDPTNLKVYVRFYYRSANVPVVRGEGEEKGFYASEGNRDPSPWTAVSELQYLGEVVSVTYYNAQGMQSNKPFSGINIVVTRYSDGSTSTMKVMK